MGIVTRAKTWSYLILGGDDPILVDTGASSTEIMGRLGMTGYTSEEQRLENQLALHGVAMGGRPLDPPHAHPHRPRGAGRPLPRRDRRA